MAHHDSPPRNSRAHRPMLLALVVLMVLAVLLSAAIWRMGGFAAAGEEPAQDPGTTITNDLFAIDVPEEATLITHESDYGDPRFELAVPTKLTSHETSPEAASVILGLVEAVLLPADEEADPDRITIERDSGTTTSYPWVQPATTETVTLHWELPIDTDPEEMERVEEIRLRVLDATHEEGFLDQDAQWRNTNGKSVGDAVVPITHVTEEG